MRDIEDKKRLIEILSEVPYIIYACKKIGIARATFYRWCSEDEDFHQAVLKAMKYSRQDESEKIEMKMAKRAKEGDFNSGKFFLEHNDDRYRKYKPERNPYDFDPVPLLEYCIPYLEFMFGPNFDHSAMLKKIETIDISDPEDNPSKKSLRYEVK
ncbi:MAG: hypothetical protein V4439_00305 [Patescibacteria group bacterium]